LYRIAVLALLFWAGSHVGFSWEAIAQGLPAMGRLGMQLFPPDLDPAFLATLGKPVLETLLLSVSGMALAVVIGFPLAIAGTQTLWRGTSTAEEVPPPFGMLGYHAARRLLDAFRAIPDLAWALLFVAVVGLGPVPGILACGIAYAGMLGKGWSEIFETVDPLPPGALRGLGGGRLPTFVHAVLPSAWPAMVAYSFYAWECCMRASALMGFVGAGGIGYQIDLAMRMFEFRQASTLLITLLILVGLVDLASHAVRRWILALPRLDTFLTGGLVAAVAAGGWSVREDWHRLVSPDGASRVARFLAESWPPQMDASSLGTLLPRLFETVAISVVATALGATLGLVLCVPAMRPPVAESGSNGLLRGIQSAAYHGSRGLLNWLRSIPEVLWALLFVVAVGLGPLAGSLALGVHTGGVLGKLYAEALEETDFMPYEGLLGVGAPAIASLFHAVVPIAAPVLASYTLLRWEVNLRVATILGFVGGGGLGQELWNQIQLGFYHRVMALTIVIFALVVLVDLASARLRHAMAR
jgi:phosphonate transport system permease protein